MKPARDVQAVSAEEQRLQAFDLREIDAADQREHFALKYVARVEAVRRVVRERVRPGGVTLEVGSAQANLSLLLAEDGYRAIALDLLPEALGYARKKHEHGEFAVVCGAAEALPVKPRCCEAVLVCELLEHCARPADVLRSIAACLADDGILIITTHNGGRLRSPDPTWSEVRSEEVEWRQYGRGGEDHLFAFTPAELVRVTREAGLRVVRAEHHGSMLHSDRLMVLKRLLGPRVLRALARLLCRLPVIGPLTSLTLLVVATRAESGEQGPGGRNSNAHTPVS